MKDELHKINTNFDETEHKFVSKTNKKSLKHPFK